jgi:hypothetical protein
MGSIAALFSLEIAAWIARIVIRWIAAAFLTHEDFVRCPGVQQYTVNAEMLVAAQF